MIILDLTVHVTGVQEVRSPSGTARMILFDGHCSGDYFQGEIEPGGVDTQYLAPDGQGTLSARYMLSGTDCEGKPARIASANSKGCEAAADSVMDVREDMKVES